MAHSRHSMPGYHHLVPPGQKHIYVLMLTRIGSCRTATKTPYAGPPISAEISGEDALVDLADVSVFRVNHLRAACFRDLAKQHVSFGSWNLPIILHPIDHLLEGNTHGVFQRTGAT